MNTPRPDIIVGGKKIGRLRASMLLFKECFRFMSHDKEMLMIPIIAFVIQLFLLGASAIVLYSLGFFAVLQDEGAKLTPEEYVFVFVWYVIGAFMVAWTQAAIAHIVYTRAHGGDATLGQGIGRATRLWPALLLWSVITSTVGIILRSIAERSGILGKVVIALLGATWAVLTYFVVPSMVIGRRSSIAAIKDSALVFKRTWGETFVTNISFSLVVVLAFLGYVVVLVGIGFLAGWSVGIGIVLILLLTLGVLVLSLVSATLSSILRTLLYIYASEQVTPTNFNKELLDQMLVKRGSVVPAGVGTSAV
jgi:Family of unknown function (DUF6159)